jgi:hypothetical protein
MPSSMITTSWPVFDHALGPLDGELGDMGVLIGRAIEGRRDDLAAQHQRRMSVTSSGRSSTSSTNSSLRDCSSSIARAICFMMVVLPAFGGDTIMPRWPMPIGEMRSMMRAVMFVGSSAISMRSFWSGNSGVRSSKRDDGWLRQVTGR